MTPHDKPHDSLSRHNDNAATTVATTATPVVATATTPTKAQLKAQRQRDKTVAKQKRRDDKRRQRLLTMRAAVANQSTIATIALLGGLVAVVVINFALSFSGLYDYGDNLAELPLFLPAFVPLGVDGLTITAVGALYILRHAPLATRLFVWVVYLVPVALSVAGNVAHATARGQHVAAIVGAAAWPILLTLAMHLVIVAARYMDVAKLVVGDNTDDTLSRERDTFEIVATQACDIVATISDTATPVVVPVATGDDTDTTGGLPREFVEMRARQGAANRDIVAELKDLGRDTDTIGVRNIQRWAKVAREALEETKR